MHSVARQRDGDNLDVFQHLACILTSLVRWYGQGAKLLYGRVGSDVKECGDNVRYTVDKVVLWCG